jgi:hypothetical protein
MKIRTQLFIANYVFRVLDILFALESYALYTQTGENARLVFCGILLLQGCFIGNWVNLYMDETYEKTFACLFVLCLISSCTIIWSSGEMSGEPIPHYLITYHMMPLAVSCLNMPEKKSLLEKPLLIKSDDSDDDETPV